MSGCVDSQPWYHQRYDNTSFWRACGFSHGPLLDSSMTPHQGARAVRCRVRRAWPRNLFGWQRARDPNVGRWVFVDGTEPRHTPPPITTAGPSDDCPDRDINQFQRLDTQARAASPTRCDTRPHRLESLGRIELASAAASASPQGSLVVPSRCHRRPPRLQGRRQGHRGWDGHSLIAVSTTTPAPCWPGMCSRPAPRRSRPTSRQWNASSRRPAEHHSPSSPTAASHTTRCSSTTPAAASAASSPIDATVTTNQTGHRRPTAGTSKAFPSVSTAAAAPTSSSPSSTAACPASGSAARCPKQATASKTSPSTAPRTSAPAAAVGDPRGLRHPQRSPLRVRAHPRPQPRPLPHRPRLPRPAPQAHRRGLATTPRLRRDRHRMAPRLLPPRLARQRRPPRATPPTHLQERPPTDPRDTGETWTLGRRHRRPTITRRPRTTRLAPRRPADTAARPQGWQQHAHPAAVIAHLARRGPSDDARPAGFGEISRARETLRTRLWNSRWNTPCMGGRGFEPL